MEQWRQYRHPKVYQSELRKERKTRKPVRITRGMIALAGAAVAIIAGGWLFLWSGYFSIKTIKASGEVTPALQTGLDSYKGTSILFFKENELFKRLQGIDPALASIQVVRGFPDQLQVTILRRHPALVWQSGTTQWAIDEEGVAFPVTDPSVLIGRPLVVDRRSQPVTAYKQLLAPEFVTFIEQAFDQTPAAVGGKIVRAEVDETTFYVYLVTEWNWSVILDTSRPIEGQLANLELLLKDHRGDIHEYVDLRIAGRAYVK